MTDRPPRPRPFRPAPALPLALVLALTMAGCASHRDQMAQVETELLRGDFPAALARHEEAVKKPDDVLEWLERGYLLHLAGRWVESNDAFEAAERRSEDLYTRSLGNEALALVTTDKLRPYRGAPYELQFVHYYRALNYTALGLTDDALVEARKASQALARHADDRGPESGPQPASAFLHHVTGLLYAAGGEANDAAVSFRLAAGLYAASAEAGAFPPPPGLARELLVASRRVGLTDLADSLREAHPELEAESGAAPANLVLFLESGHVPSLREVSITLPILEDSPGDDWDRAHRYVNRYGEEIYRYGDGHADLDHVLRFAIPEPVDRPSEVGPVTLRVEGAAWAAAPALDLAAVARADFDRRLPGILLRTVARALAKEGLRKAGKEADDTLGDILNLVGVLSEQADTRSFLLLPGRIDLLEITLPPGETRLTVEFADPRGVVIEEVTIPVLIEPFRPRFLSVRCFR